MADVLDIAMFATVCAVLLAGFPVAFSIAGTALAFALLGAAVGVLDLRFVAFLPQRIFGTMQNEVLIAVPLFVFMGVMLERSKVAEDLLESMGQLFGSMRGGLGISVTVVGALLAAVDGDRRGNRGHHGPVVAAYDAAARLRPEARLRFDLRSGHAGPDHPAINRAGSAGRSDQHCLPGVATRTRHLRARDCLGR